jgi:hypothetical protein
MPTATKTKEQLAAEAIAGAQEVLGKVLSKTPKASAAQKEQARKARAGARVASGTTRSKISVPSATKTPASTSSAHTATRSNLAGVGGVSFVASDYMTGDIWVPDARIPAIDEATYEARKTQAEGQSRSIEVASLNLKNIAGLHKLEGQAVDIAIAAKGNETRYAKLEGAEIGLQTQLQANGEATQRLMQAQAKHEAASRETGYTSELIGLKDQNFQLEIQQAQTLFSEKSARYRAQLTGRTV